MFDPEFEDTVDDEVINALSSQFLFQLGFLLILPIPLLLAVEQVTLGSRCVMIICGHCVILVQ